MTMSMEVQSLSLRALPTAELRRRRGRATALAADPSRPIVERLAGLLAGAVIDHGVDGVAADPTDAALKLLRAERDVLTRMIKTLENSR